MLPPLANPHCELGPRTESDAASDTSSSSNVSTAATLVAPSSCPTPMPVSRVRQPNSSTAMFAAPPAWRPLWPRGLTQRQPQLAKTATHTTLPFQPPTKATLVPTRIQTTNMNTPTPSSRVTVLVRNPHSFGSVARRAGTRLTTPTLPGPGPDGAPAGFSYLLCCF
ncbi:hypothetical protein BCR44DRAFT_1186026 [Catenaria anguillulae PL171]|uniref:Uncharacterized protein n=1 Tax=Catenaria anguillulae PL171 TaxID=765915 RepID=A0A1Y2HJN8_9FUNG|nr:hypothetical protein BCR44DRAFT_1186026 [Catenaria anguillulae PL171]